MNNYLIPANSKKSLLIFGLFKQFDLLLFGLGIGITLFLLLVLPIDQSIVIAIAALAPVAITGFLVLPIPNYHNIRVLILTLYIFYTEKRRFIWKGWCANDGEQK